MASSAMHQNDTYQTKQRDGEFHWLERATLIQLFGNQWRRVIRAAEWPRVTQRPFCACLTTTDVLANTLQFSLANRVQLFECFADRCSGIPIRRFGASDKISGRRPRLSIRMIIDTYTFHSICVASDYAVSNGTATGLQAHALLRINTSRPPRHNDPQRITEHPLSL